MKNSNKKTIATIKAKIGSVEVMAFLFFIALLVISVLQFLNEDYKIDWLYIIFSILTLITLLLAFVNFKSKTIELTEKSLTIKRPLRLYSKTYLKEDLKGFDLQEFYDTQIGLTRQIRIWTKDDRRIVLVRDAYSDYDRVLTELKKFGLNFLGNVELKSTYKQFIGITLKIMTVMTILLFMALTLVKLLK